MGTERKQALAEEIIALEDEYAVLHEQSQQTRERIGMIRRHSRSLIFRLLLGRRLPRELGKLWSSIEKGTDPLLGPELSAVLNSATRRILGYKRWILLFGFFAASPASISMLLLWQQSNAVEREKEDASADSRLVDRARQLDTIYLTRSGEEAESLTTPLASRASRRNAVFRLIELDSVDLQRGTYEGDDEALRKAVEMVDLSIAPLEGVDFSPFPGEIAPDLRQVSFVNANLRSADFSGRVLTDVWFDNADLSGSRFLNTTLERVDFRKANLAGVNFRGAQFSDCLFEGAFVDETTEWPQGFSSPTPIVPLSNPEPKEQP